MPLKQIRELQLTWFGNQKEPSDFTKYLDRAFDKIGFSESFVNDVIASRGYQSQRTKVVKDNVWGMIELDEYSIRLLDCPIIQRLRRIRQLGFSYLTYPSAEHSRFVHSLGMLGVISRFIDSANRSPRAPSSEGHPFQPHSVSPQDRLDLLHAALLHDTGHLPFSHASEFALESLSEFTQVGGLCLADFFAAAEDIGVRKTKLAELLSVAVVLSRRFGRYYREYVRAEEPSTARDDSPLRIASLILGKPTNETNVGYAELISGHVIDADKLDYVSRDGLACGIPTGIDVGRLFLRSEFFRFPKEELNRLRKRFGYGLVDQDQVHFIVNSSGRDTIEELISARTSLYHRVYFHQTTRNAERLYEQLIEAAITSPTERASLDSVDIWSSSDEQFLSKLAESSDEKVRRLAIRIASRRLPRRAVVFGQNELASLFPLKSVFSHGGFQYDEGPLRLPHLKKFSKRSLFGKSLSSLESAVEDECVVLHNLIKNDLTENSPLSLAQGRPHIVISPAQFSPLVHDDCLVLQNRELVYSKELHNVTQTNDAEEIFRASGYILTDEPWRELAFVAARKLLAEHTKDWLCIEVRVDENPRNAQKEDASTTPPQPFTANSAPPEIFTAKAFTLLHLDKEKVIGRTNISKSVVDDVETCAARKGYFDNAPFLASKPSIKWESLSGKFSKFEGQYGWRITRELVEAFIWQFPPRFRQACTELLNGIEILDSHSAVNLTHQALLQFQNQAKGRSKVKIAPLSPNSGHELRIALETRFRNNIEFRKQFEIYHTLEELLSEEDSGDYAIALIDDNVVSGSQAFSQLATWLAIDKQRWPQEIAGETNIDKVSLSEDSRRKFTGLLGHSKVGICVAFGSASKSSKNREIFAKLVSTPGLDSDKDSLFDSPPFEIPLVVGRDIQVPNDGALKNEEFNRYLAEIGAELIASSRFGKSLSKLDPIDRKTCITNSMGYDNAQGMTLTFRNVPVSTLTCIWCPGEFLERPWIPLAIRRGYAQRIIVS